ncbi:hypothetical protein LTS17_000350 [Exophiala oligosperma]
MFSRKNYQATTLTRLDRQRATTLGREFWNGAKLHLPFVFEGAGHDVLRAMLLLARYGFLYPQACDPFICAGEAMSLALQMGLQHEAVADRGKLLSQKERDERRILFWSTYIMNWLVSLNEQTHDSLGNNPLRLTAYYGVNADEANQLPYVSANGMLNSFLSRSSYVAPHVWSARMLELETLAMIYSPSSAAMTADDFQDWQNGLTHRLQEWHNATHSSVDDVLATTIQFHDIIYHFLIFRLNRPSPGYPVPTLDMRRQSIRAALKVVDIYAINDRNGMLLYHWHAAYHLCELGAFLLQFMLGAIRAYSLSDFRQIEEIESEILPNTVNTVIYILWKVVGRWSEAGTSVRSLEQVARPILEAFDAWCHEQDYGTNILSQDPPALLGHLAGLWSLPIMQTFDTG